MIYISGAISGTNNYMERFAVAEKRLTDEGKQVINPANVTHQLPSSTDYEMYMELDMLMLSWIPALLSYTSFCLVRVLLLLAILQF